MGAHHARQTSQVGRIAGRGALTAAAALALTGGTASFAFAGEAPQDAGHSQECDHGHEQGSSSEHVTKLSAAGLEKHYGDKLADLEHKGDDALGHGSESVHGLTSSLAGTAGGDQAKASEKKIYDKVADSEHKVVDAKGKGSEQVHHLTGSSAKKFDDTLADAQHKASDKTPSMLSFV